jgi:hypothetical protein
MGNYEPKLLELLGQRLVPRLKWIGGPAHKHIEAAMSALNRIQELYNLNTNVVHVAGN